MSETKDGRCPNYTGISCVDGSCPIANIDKYIEYGVPVTQSCDYCYMYNGCSDCCWLSESNECSLEEKNE